MPTLLQIANLVDGRVRGDETVEIKGFCSLDIPRSSCISFLESASHRRKLIGAPLSAILTTNALKDAFPNVIIVEEPRLSFVRVMDYFLSKEKKPKRKTRVHELAVVAKSARIGKRVSVGAYAVIGGDTVIGDDAEIGANCFVGEKVTLGSRTRLFPCVAVMDGCVIGNDCVIHSGTVIGSDGFGYVTTRNGHKKFPQVGTVVIEDEVEIGALCAIDRASLDETRIGRGTKIDNLVQVAHNVNIGEHCLIAAQVGISGRTEIGNWSVIGGQAGFQGGVVVGEGSVIAAQTGVFGSLPPKSRVSGYPARPHDHSMRILALTWRLPELVEKIKALEEEISRLKKSTKAKK